MQAEARRLRWLAPDCWNPWTWCKRRHGDTAGWHLIALNLLDLVQAEATPQQLVVSCASWHLPPICTPEYLQGLPSNNAEQQARVISSQRLMYRCSCLLRAVFAAGGHVSLEQPPNAMSWQEDFAQPLISEIQASLVVIPACTVGQDWTKPWMFASSPALRSCARLLATALMATSIWNSRVRLNPRQLFLTDGRVPAAAMYCAVVEANGLRRGHIPQQHSSATSGVRA